MATITAAERRAAEREDFNAYLAECPSRMLLEQLSSKWVVLLLCALADGPQRYSDLGRRVAGVSQKMLTQTLRALERDGLITRSVRPTVPVTVSYEMTDLGRSLHTVVLQVKGWAELNMSRVLHARTEYDARPEA